MASMTSGSDDTNHIEKLVDINNFQLWKFQITVILKAQGLYEIVNGEIKKPKPEDTKEVEKWLQKDAKAQKVIVTTLDKKPLMHILNCDSAKAMFNKICIIYQKDNEQQKCMLLQEFFNYSYDKNGDMATHISKLENIAFRLNAINSKIDESMLTTKILVTLPEKYKHFVSAWESTQPNEKNLTNLTARLLAEEVRCNTATDKNETVAFKSFEKKCFICKGNHIARFCKNKTNTSSSNSRYPCKICKKTNHSEKECYFRKNKGQNKETNENKVTFLTHTTDDSKTTWVVDSGSSSHMSNQKEIMKNMTKSSSEIAVAKLSQSMRSEGVGTVEFSNCILNNVLYVPELSKNLISVNAITQNGGEVKFTDDKVVILKNQRTILEGYKNKTGLYTINIETSAKQEALNTEKRKLAEEWHQKLGHLSVGNMKKLLNMSHGMNISVKDIDELNHVCETCTRAKQTRQPFKEERTRASRPLEIIHTDVCGPIQPSTWDNKSYFITFLDDYTHFCMIYLMRNKSETQEIVKDYIAQAEAKWDLKVSKLRCDNGGEYINKQFKEWSRQKGIILDYTTPHTPQLNGKAERLNRTLMEKARALIADSQLEKKMWGEAAQSAAYLLNRSPTETLSVTPAEKWFKKKPDLSRLQIFGSKSYAKTQGYLQKLDDRSKTCVFIGYAMNSYRLWDPINEKIMLSRDVIFEKTRNESQNQTKETHEPQSKTNGNFQYNTEDESMNEEDLEQSEETMEIRRSDRSKRLPEKYNDYVLLSYEEAINGSDKTEWLKAIQEEKKSLHKNDTWEIVDKSEAGNNKILSSRWIFKIKEDGRYKARLVIRGCEQKYGINFDETFSPVINSSSLRIIFALAAKQNKIIMKFDIKSAFLYGDLDENIYMLPPEGFKIKDKICKLKKALYGLKQAPLKWNEKFTSLLVKKGLEPIKSEQCVFKNTHATLILAIYVDDGILIGDNKIEMENLLEELKSEFEMTISKQPKTFLGIEIHHSSEGIKLTQTKYSRRILEKFNMHDSKPAATPMILNNQMTEQADIQGSYPYREGIGSLLYLSNKTRPDLAFSVGHGSRHLDKPTTQDVANLKRVFRYINGTHDEGLKYFTKGEMEISAYCDADYAGDVETRKSTTGYVIMFCGGPISWCSRKQPIVALSSTEAEYIAAAECCRELMYLRGLIEELIGKKMPSGVNLHIDNQSAIKLIKNGTVNRRSKHIDVRYHFINEKVEEGAIKICYCPSEEQLADILTKPLGNNKFSYFKNMLICNEQVDD